MDYQFPRCSRRCSVSGRELSDGEWFYTVLLPDGADYKRVDFALDAWQGPPDQAAAWWKAQIPLRETSRQRMAPNEALWQFFVELRTKQDRPDLLYVLTLLLIRRRVLRDDEGPTVEAPPGTLVCFSPRDEQTYQIPPVDLRTEQIGELQAELERLLWSNA